MLPFLPILIPTYFSNAQLILSSATQELVFSLFPLFSFVTWIPIKKRSLSRHSCLLQSPILNKLYTFFHQPLQKPVISSQICELWRRVETKFKIQPIWLTNPWKRDMQAFYKYMLGRCAVCSNQSFRTPIVRFQLLTRSTVLHILHAVWKMPIACARLVWSKSSRL